MTVEEAKAKEAEGREDQGGKARMAAKVVGRGRGRVVVVVVLVRARAKGEREAKVGKGKGKGKVGAVEAAEGAEKAIQC